MKYLIIIVLVFFTSSTFAKCGVVIPLFTDHIVHSGNVDFNESNKGLGVECYFNKYTIGGMRAKNSFKQDTTFIYGAKTMFHESVNVGVIAGNNYADQSFTTFDQSVYENILLSPFISYQYGYVRVMTTYPFAKISTQMQDANWGADIVNVQIVIPFN